MGDDAEKVQANDNLPVRVATILKLGESGSVVDFELDQLAPGEFGTFKVAAHVSVEQSADAAVFGAKVRERLLDPRIAGPCTARSSSTELPPIDLDPPSAEVLREERERC